MFCHPLPGALYAVSACPAVGAAANGMESGEVHTDVSDRAAGQQLMQHLVVHALAIAACGTMSGNCKLIEVG